MGGTPDPPPAPDPKETAAAQTQQNVQTAVAQSYLNNVDQYTPDGSLTYDVSGYETVRNPDGTTIQVPRWIARQQFSPEQAEIYGINKQTERNLSELGRDQSARLQDLLSAPMSLDNEAVESRLMELGQKRLNPMLDRRREQTANRLAQQGITLGSEAYDRAMGALTEGENDAFNQLLLNGRSQAISEAKLERDQPINEITALLSGSQVSNPQFANINSAQLANTDVAGLTMQDYQNRLGAWNIQQQQKQAKLGGLLGFGGSLITGGLF